MSKHSKTRFFSVRLTNQEYEHLQLACHIENTTQSEFLRRNLINLLQHGNYVTDTKTTSTN